MAALAWSVAEAAEQLGCSYRTVKRLIDSGDLPAVSLRTSGTKDKLVVPKAELKDWLRDRAVEQADRRRTEAAS